MSVYVLINSFANKQDIDGALSEQDIDEQFELEQLAKKCESCYRVVRKNN